MTGMQQGVNGSVYSQTKITWGREVFLALMRAVDPSNMGLIGVAFIKNM